MRESTRLGVTDLQSCVECLQKGFLIFLLVIS